MSAIENRESESTQIKRISHCLDRYRNSQVTIRKLQLQNEPDDREANAQLGQQEMKRKRSCAGTEHDGGEQRPSTDQTDRVRQSRPDAGFAVVEQERHPDQQQPRAEQRVAFRRVRPEQRERGIPQEEDDRVAIEHVVTSVGLQP